MLLLALLPRTCSADSVALVQRSRWVKGPTSSWPSATPCPASCCASSAGCGSSSNSSSVEKCTPEQQRRDKAARALGVGCADSLTEGLRTVHLHLHTCTGAASSCYTRVFMCTAVPCPISAPACAPG
jgi:hypothetical protein